MRITWLSNASPLQNYNDNNDDGDGADDDGVDDEDGISTTQEIISWLELAATSLMD